MREGIVATAVPHAWAWLLPLIATASMATAGMPDRSWRGIERLVVLCAVDAGDELGHAEIASGLCERIVRIAGPGSPVPIEIVDAGRAPPASARAVTLTVHASVVPTSTAVPGARGRLLSWTMRTSGTNLIDDEPTLSGTAPRLAPFGGDANSDRLDSSLLASLGDLLPWLRPTPFNQIQQR